MLLRSESGYLPNVPQARPTACSAPFFGAHDIPLEIRVNKIATFWPVHQLILELCGEATVRHREV